jgi:hypothetical protein
MRRDNGTSDREFILLQTNPERFPYRLHVTDRRGFNMINVIKIVGEVASPKLIGK